MVCLRGEDGVYDLDAADFLHERLVIRRLSG